MALLMSIMAMSTKLTTLNLSMASLTQCATKEMGYALVVVTNQSGIARGKFTEAQFETLTEWMDWSLADRGVDLDGIYYCPHHPQGTVEEYRQTCDCRKPHPGMLISARDYLHIDMAASYMVGDKLEDMQAARRRMSGLKCWCVPVSRDARSGKCGGLGD
jgi:D,D-heptose 1,7-bisphosphate phosphatase